MTPLDVVILGVAGCVLAAVTITLDQIRKDSKRYEEALRRPAPQSPPRRETRGERERGSEPKA
jgi:uncharacterized OsmC-like protein